MNRIFELLERPRLSPESEQQDSLQSYLHVEPFQPKEILPELEPTQQLHLDVSELDFSSFEAPSNTKIKKQRGNKKDNFNYEMHIKKELQKMDLANMTKKEKKIAI
jgi:hypothetical protein